MGVDSMAISNRAPTHFILLPALLPALLAATVASSGVFLLYHTHFLQVEEDPPYLQ